MLIKVTSKHLQYDSSHTTWLICPICKSKTRTKLRKDTVLKNYPLYCPKCKNECLIEVKNLYIKIIKEPDA